MGTMPQWVDDSALMAHDQRRLHFQRDKTDCMGKVLKDTDYLVYPTGKRQERHMAGKGVNIELFLA